MCGCFHFLTKGFFFFCKYCSFRILLSLNICFIFIVIIVLLICDQSVWKLNLFTTSTSLNINLWGEVIKSISHLEFSFGAMQVHVLPFHFLKKVLTVFRLNNWQSYTIHSLLFTSTIPIWSHNIVF